MAAQALSYVRLMRLQWFILKTNNGHENKVRGNLIQKLDSSKKRQFVPQIVIPTEQVIEIKDGQKVPKEVRKYPGYLLVQARLPMVYSELKDTKGVRGFVGAGDEPAPLSAEEVAKMIGHAGRAPERSKAPAFKVGDTVRITSGPLVDFTGEISQVDTNSAKLTLLVPIFGRPTATEVEWSQVRKDS
jgi:transcriptional antiterminator NusG